MYSKLGGGLAAAGAAGTPFTGLSIGWSIVLGVTALAVGFAIARVIPKRQKGRRS